MKISSISNYMKAIDSSLKPGHELPISRTTLKYVYSDFVEVGRPGIIHSFYRNNCEKLDEFIQNPNNNASHCTITGENITCRGQLVDFAKALKNNTELQYLEFNETNIDDEDLKILAPVLPYTKIATLGLICNNGIGDEGIKALAAVLPDTNITRLNLFGCRKISAEGLARLSDVIPNTMVISVFGLSHLDRRNLHRIVEQNEEGRKAQFQRYKNAIDELRKEQNSVEYIRKKDEVLKLLSPIVEREGLETFTYKLVELIDEYQEMLRNDRMALRRNIEKNLLKIMYPPIKFKTIGKLSERILV